MQLAVVPRLHRPLRSERQPDPLRDRLASVVEASALELLDPDRIEAIGEDMRIVRRHRVHHTGLIVCSLILSAFERSTDTEGRWLDAQCTYEALGGPEAGKTSFRNQTRKLLPVLGELLRRRLCQIAEAAPTSALQGRLRAFTNVLVPDGCAFKVASALSGLYPGTGQAAELKLHAVYNVAARTATSVEMSAGCVHDSDGFWPARWESGALYIWDLGYNSHMRFIDAVVGGAVVLQRLKEGANPIVVASYGPTGARGPVVGDDGRPVRLLEACAFGWVHHQRVLDLDVELTDERRSVLARVVCVPFGGEDRYYLTTLPRAVFSAHDVAELYRVRWEVELFFRNWKGAVRLDEVRRLEHPASLQVAVTASLLAAVLARDMSTGLERIVDQAARESVAIPP
jgi:Transposase DDE domain